jgi:hypothetical protein
MCIPFYNIFVTKKMRDTKKVFFMTMYGNTLMNWVTVLSRVLSPQDWQHYTSQQAANRSPNRPQFVGKDWYTL